ncbi:MAG: ATP-dependent zinc protease [Pseudomonadaceae bacterium]|nr:ATP-dependent zinc protease [Pseudomonadaceae bacterium]
MKTFEQLCVIGLREWVGLPELGLSGLRAKIDTGASTSSLHATDCEVFVREGISWLRFTAHVGSRSKLREQRCEAPLVTVKTVKSSNGHSQTRYVIRSQLSLGAHTWSVDFSLTCRKSMQYRLLIGAQALIDGQLLVNPALSYMQPKPGASKPLQYPPAPSPALTSCATGVK